MYAALEAKIAAWTTERDTLCAQTKQMLEGADFSGLSINEQAAKAVLDQSQSLLDRASACAANPAACAN